MDFLVGKTGEMKVRSACKSFLWHRGVMVSLLGVLLGLQGVCSGLESMDEVEEVDGWCR